MAREKRHHTQSKAGTDVETYAAKSGPFVSAVNTTRMPMIFTDAKSAKDEIVYVNESFVKLSGFERSYLIGKPFSQLLSRESQNPKRSLLELADCKDGTSTISCMRNGGGAFDAAVSVSPVEDKTGVLLQYFVSFMDLTEYIERERKLIHLSRFNAMGTMAAILAHELNQPLAAISNYVAGCLNTLESSGFKAPKLEKGLRAIGMASARAGGVIRTLRNMTRKAAPRSEPFSLGDALYAAIGLVRAGGCPGIEIIGRNGPSAWVRADRTQIEQVIVNLLMNACESGATTVTASISKEIGEVRLSVEDNGTGVPSDAIEDLFEWSDSSKGNGMGIGLSISRTIIESSGGRIALDQTSDEGSCFSLWLPEYVPMKSGT